MTSKIVDIDDGRLMDLIFTGMVRNDPMFS